MLAEKIGGAGLIRITTATAYVVAILTSVAPTAAYFALSRAELRFAAEKEAIQGAHRVAEVLRQSTQPGSLHGHNFTDLLTQRATPETAAAQRIVDANGATVAESKDPLGSWPITASSPIEGPEGRIGSFEVSRSIAEVFGNMVGITIISLWFATWSFLFLRILPDRALKNALNEAIESREAANSALLARDKAEEASRLRSVFLSNMGHELRTPLNGVLGMIDLIADTELDAEQRSYVSLASSSGRGLLTIINDILDFSKLDEGKIEIVAASFVLRELLMQSTEVFRAEAQKKALQLEWTLAPDLPQLVVADPVRIRQVLASLIGNALKFTATGGVTVTASKLLQNQQQYLEFVVADTGIGIAKEQLDYIFQPFTQVDESTTRLHGGAGLGLAISRQLAQSMDGSLWAISDPGRGSAFHFTVPLISGA